MTTTASTLLKRAASVQEQARAALDALDARVERAQAQERKAQDALQRARDARRKAEGERKALRKLAGATAKPLAAKDGSVDVSATSPKRVSAKVREQVLAGAPEWVREHTDAKVQGAYVKGATGKADPGYANETRQAAYRAGTGA